MITYALYQSKGSSKMFTLTTSFVMLPHFNLSYSYWDIKLLPECILCQELAFDPLMVFSFYRALSQLIIIFLLRTYARIANLRLLLPQTLKWYCQYSVCNVIGWPLCLMLLINLMIMSFSYFLIYSLRLRECIRREMKIFESTPSVYFLV